MASPSSPDVPAARDGLARARERYRYRDPRDNAIAPVCIARSWPWLEQQYGPSWILPFLPGFVRAQARHFVGWLRAGFQRATFRLDPLEAYHELFSGPPPPFAPPGTTDAAYEAAFGWWRIAGANPLLLRREESLAALQRRLPLDVARVERWLANRVGAPVALQEAAQAGRVFSVDFRLIQSALQPERTRDTRWRRTYLPAPIGAFLEYPGAYARCSLVPLALRIDQPQPDAEPNPVYYPDQRWPWRIARTYFEVADATWQAAVGHVLRTHLAMEPFAIATPRQLSPRHPVRLLLEPHLRFTLTANQAAYRYLVDRNELYDELYSGTLEELRRLVVQAYLEHDFADLEFEADLARRGVSDAPAAYPYRDDLRLWVQPIRDFARAWVTACWPDDAAVQADVELQRWAEELVDPARGAVRRLVPGDRLDGREKLAALLAQILFTAGPGHASQHFSANHFYRYAPVFAAGAYQPPPRERDPVDFPRWLAMLPPLEVARHQFRSNTYTSFRYDRFGDYGRHALARMPQAREPIRRLQSALAEIERTIAARQGERLFAYDFALPSRVPNSVNI